MNPKWPNNIQKIKLSYEFSFWSWLKLRNTKSCKINQMNKRRFCSRYRSTLARTPTQLCILYRIAIDDELKRSQFYPIHVQIGQHHINFHRPLKFILFFRSVYFKFKRIYNTLFLFPQPILYTNSLSNIHTSCNYFLQHCILNIFYAENKRENWNWNKTTQKNRSDGVECRQFTKYSTPKDWHPFWTFSLHLTFCRISNFIWIVCVSHWKLTEQLFHAETFPFLLLLLLSIRIHILHYKRMYFFLCYSEDIHFNVNSILHLNSIFGAFVFTVCATVFDGHFKWHQFKHFNSTLWFNQH